MQIPYNNNYPDIHKTVFMAPGCHLIGDVTIGKESSIWFNAVLRGDEDAIRIGEKCSIQDNSTIHLYEGCSTTIDDEVTVGHNVILHGCHIGKRSIIGIGATVLDNAEIGEECIIGANTLIPSGKTIPPRSLVVGSPGKVVRSLTPEDDELIQLSIDTYIKKGREFKDIVEKEI